MVSDTCKKAISVNAVDADQADLMYQLKYPKEGELNMILLISGVVA